MAKNQDEYENADVDKLKSLYNEKVTECEHGGKRNFGDQAMYLREKWRSKTLGDVLFGEKSTEQIEKIAFFEQNGKQNRDLWVMQLIDYFSYCSSKKWNAFIFYDYAEVTSDEKIMFVKYRQKFTLLQDKVEWSELDCELRLCNLFAEMSNLIYHLHKNNVTVGQLFSLEDFVFTEDGNLRLRTFITCDINEAKWDKNSSKFNDNLFLAMAIYKLYRKTPPKLVSDDLINILRNFVWALYSVRSANGDNLNWISRCINNMKIKGIAAGFDDGLCVYKVVYDFAKFYKNVDKLQTNMEKTISLTMKDNEQYLEKWNQLKCSQMLWLSNRQKREDMKTYCYRWKVNKDVEKVWMVQLVEHFSNIGALQSLAEILMVPQSIVVADRNVLEFVNPHIEGISIEKSAKKDFNAKTFIHFVAEMVNLYRMFYQGNVVIGQPVKLSNFIYDNNNTLLLNVYLSLVWNLEWRKDSNFKEDLVYLLDAILELFLKLSVTWKKSVDLQYKVQNFAVAMSQMDSLSDENMASLAKTDLLNLYSDDRKSFLFTKKTLLYY